MRNETSSNYFSQASTGTGIGRHLRQKSRVDYSNIPESYHYNQAKGLNNGRWSLEEHKKFITGIFLYGNNWKEIVNLIGTRNCPQARSHSQKFFSKLPKLNLDGITEEMCNVKKLHCIYNNSTHDEIKNLFYIITDVAYKCMEDNDKQKKEEETNLPGQEEQNGNRKESFLCDIDSYKLEYSYAHLEEVNIVDDIPDPDIDIMDIDEMVEVKKPKVDNYYKWMFEKVTESIPGDFVASNKVETEDVDMVAGEINSYYDELTFNYFNSFK